MSGHVITSYSIHYTKLYDGSGQESYDFNSDGKIDFDDFSMFMNSYGTEKNEAGWDATYDLNSDGIIDVSDFEIFNNYYNKTLPKAPNT